jgi:filamentous hemagglutinin family protein
MQGTERSLPPIALIVAGSIALCNFAYLTPAGAQIVPDSTLGAESSVVTPNVNINGIVSDRIDGGAIRGTNLFHSFQDFNVGNAGAAYFTNPSGIATILSRVTGTNPSNILGTLGVLGNANLFLINPKGIIFGSNARLDVRGSFVASTADSLVFDNGLEFSATNPSSPPLLTINIPIGLRYRTQQSGAIVNAGNLTVQPGQNITLVGGSVATTGQLRAAGGQISVVAVPGDSLVNLGQGGQVLSVSPTTNPQATTSQVPSLTELLNTIDDDTRLGVMNDNQVQLKGSGMLLNAEVGTVIVSGTLDASNPAAGQTGGTVQVLGNRVGLFDRAAIDVSGDAGGGSALIGGNYQGQGSLPNALATYVGRDVTINADAINSGNGGQIVVWADNSTRAYGTLSVRGGAIGGNGGLIETSSRNFLDIAGIQVDATAPNGLAGTWLIDPRNIIIQNAATANGGFSGGNPNVFTPTGDDAVISTQDIESQLNAGTNVTITTGSTGTQEGNITIAGNITKTTGGAATLTFEAANNITLNNVEIASTGDVLNLVMTADSDRSGAGDVALTNSKIDASGGTISITANSLSLENGSFIHSDSSGNRNGGLITVNVRSLLIRESDIGSNTFGEGNAGQVIVNADTAAFERGGMSSNTEGSGNAGQIAVNAGSISFENGGFGTYTLGSGNAGQIAINADKVSFKASGLGTFSEGTGNSGQIIINAGSLFLEQSGIDSTTNGTGSGGKIEITAGSVVIKNSGISSQAYETSTGNGGQIKVTANSVLIENIGGISTETAGSGSGGDVILQVGELTIQNGGGIAVKSSGTGNAGTLTIEADALRLNNNGQISASSEGNGAAGNIQVSADSMHLDNHSSIKANTTGGEGNITLNAVDLVMRRGSEITTNATGSDKIGGNININTGVLVALENSDIAADSADFRGGNVTVTAQGIFGTGFRPVRSPLSDITATGKDSALSGIVVINTPGVDPTRGLATLPSNVVDPNTLIAQNPCELGKASAFVVTGRGGLPPNPNDALSSEAVRVDLVEPAPIGEQDNRKTSDSLSNSTPNSHVPEPVEGFPIPIVPARGWVFNEKGEVVLTAYNPNHSQPQRIGQNPAACKVP